MEEDGAYVLSVKNPDKPPPESAGVPGTYVRYPAELMDRFRDRWFGDADPPRFLDDEGTQFVLISAAEDVRRELGIELEPNEEDVAHAEIFHDLRLEKSKQPLEPLLEGSERMAAPEDEGTSRFDGDGQLAPPPYGTEPAATPRSSALSSVSPPPPAPARSAPPPPPRGDPPG